MRKSQRERSITYVVRCESDGEIARGRSCRIERDGDFCCAECRLIRARVTKNRDGHAGIDQATNFGCTIGRKNLGTNVIDVERTSDRFACFARVSRHDHGFDLRIDQMLHGGTSARSKAILKAEHADETRADSNEYDGSSECFEFGDALFGSSDRDAVGEQKRAATDTQVFA